MKKRLIQSVSALLFCSMLISLAACGAQKPDAGDVTSAAAETETAQTAEPRDTPEIMTDDLGGAVFTVLYPGWSLYNTFYFADEETGDAVNDAIFNRTRKLEEALGIDFQWVTKGYTTTIYPEVNKTVMAGEDAYSLALTHCIEGLPSLISSGVVMNWNDIPNIDMSKDYWNSSVKSNMELAGVLPFAANAFILPDINSLFFNSDMIEAYALDDPYSLVLDGGWTWDKFTALASAVSEDIDGDGEMTMADRYGFVGEQDWQFASILTSCNVLQIATDDDGMPYFDFNNERTVSIIDRLSAMLTDKTAFFWLYKPEYDPNNGNMPPVGFDEGNALFYLVPLSLASTFRAMDIDFGILPMPKYDENQSDYVSLNWAGFMCVPASASDTDMIGKTVELLGYLNSEYVLSSFYDVLLGQKISRDETSSKMLDIIFDGAVYDLAVNLGMAYTMSDCVGKGTFSSHYEKNIKKWQNSLDKYYAAHEDYAGLHK
ncbi:MAG: hypothetical protein WCQ72_00510 [Eubacteriales bacterium]